MTILIGILSTLVVVLLIAFGVACDLLMLANRDVSRLEKELDHYDTVYKMGRITRKPNAENYER